MRYVIGLWLLLLIAGECRGQGTASGEQRRGIAAAQSDEVARVKAAWAWATAMQERRPVVQPQPVYWSHPVEARPTMPMRWSGFRGSNC